MANPVELSRSVGLWPDPCPGRRGIFRRGGNTGFQFNGNDRPQFNQDWHPEDLPQSLQEAFDELRILFNEGAHAAGISQQELNTLIWLVVAAVVFFFVLGILTAIARYVAETATMRMVDEYEASGAKMTVRQGFRIGWSRTSWRLFLINLIVNLPIILLMAVLLIVGVVIFRMFIIGDGNASVAGIISLIGVAFLSIFRGDYPQHHPGAVATLLLAGLRP